MTSAGEIREWMCGVMRQTGLTPAAWAHASGVAKSTINRAIKEDYQFVTSTRTLAKLAEAAGVAPPRVDSPSVNREQPTFLSVRYEVGAGLFRMVDELSDPAFGAAPVLADPAYARFPQWLERVTGDSMNREYPEGTLLHVVDAVELGYAPRPGDHVIVQRTRGQGDHERTVKEVAFGPKGMELIARSFNPVWAEHPVQIAPDGYDQDHCEVRIVGLVLGSYRSRKAS